MSLPRRRFIVPILVLILAVLVGLKAFQKWSPIYPAIVSTNDDKRTMALSRLAELNDQQKADLRDKVRIDIGNADPRVRCFAIYALRKIGSPDENILRDVSGALGDSDVEVRKEAAVSLMEYGDAAIPYALKTLKEGNETAAQEALDLVARVGPSCLPRMLSLLEEPGPGEGQRRCLALIARWGKEAGAATAHISNLLNSPISREAALALVAVSTQNSVAFPILDKRLSQSFDLDVIKALAAMGPAAKKCVPMLRLRLLEGKDSLKNDNAQRPALARALAAIDPRKSDFNSLAWDLKQKDPVIRYRAAYELSRTEKRDVGAVPVLARSLNDSDPFVAARVATAMVRVGLKNAAQVGDVVYPRLKGLLTRVSEEKHCDGFRAVLVPALVEVQQLDSSEANKFLVK